MKRQLLVGVRETIPVLSSWQLEQMMYLAAVGEETYARRVPDTVSDRRQRGFIATFVAQLEQLKTLGLVEEDIDGLPDELKPVLQLLKITRNGAKLFNDINYHSRAIQ